MKWIVPKIWQDGEVWILGGGPSITTQFEIPDKVVESVYSKTQTPAAYSPYLKALHDKHTIGINAAYKLGNWIDMIFFGDNGFLIQNVAQLAEHPAIKVSCNPASEKYDWIRFLHRDSTHALGISSNPKAVSWNLNSGAAAISLAAHTGAKRIILLGFDMKMKDDKQHWHDEYNRSQNRKKTMNLPFERHLKGFHQIAKDAKAMGIEIINACPDSAITVFRKANVKELL